MQSRMTTKLVDSLYVEAMVLADPSDAALLQSKAADFLKFYRDSGAGDLPVGPADRLPRSLSLSCGEEIASAELEMWMEQLALDPWARGLAWRDQPQAKRLQEFSVAVIGAGAGV